MKKYCLLYAILIAFFIAGCKKSDKFAQGETEEYSTDTAQTPNLISLKINGANCAFDNGTKSFYFPVSVGTSLTSYTVNFDTTITKAIYIEDIRVKNGGTVQYELKTNKVVKVRAVNKLNTGPTYDLTITGMPIVMLNADDAIADDKVKASFNLVNPDYQAQGSKLEISSNILIAIRGKTARNFPKKAYAVHLVDNKGAEADVSLLGLRKDDSWILDAMYIDQARMRNRLCTDIWNSFNNVPYIANEPKALNGTRGYMTEVFLNYHYIGIYCLTEKLDRKQLQVSKDYGDMYKADDWGKETQFSGVNIGPDDLSSTWYGWTLEYPELGDTPAPNWGYMDDIVTFISQSSDQAFSSSIASKVDINNMVDYYLFMNITEAFDNQAKNTFFSFYDYRINSKFFYSPWDLDGTMGRNYDGGGLPNAILGTDMNNLFKRLLTLNAANFKGLLKTRWNALKADQLSKTAVNARIEGYRKLMVGTNAFARERATWITISQDLDTETQYMNNWYSDQYDLFDSYINGLQ